MKLDFILQIINYIDHCLKEKIKKVIGLVKNELGGKVMIKFVGLRVKTSSYLIDDSSENKKVKGTKKCIIKRKLKFKIIKTLSKQLNLRIK